MSSYRPEYSTREAAAPRDNYRPNDSHKPKDSTRSNERSVNTNRDVGNLGSNAGLHGRRDSGYSTSNGMYRRRA